MKTCRGLYISLILSEFCFSSFVLAFTLILLEHLSICAVLSPPRTVTSIKNIPHRQQSPLRGCTWPLRCFEGRAAKVKPIKLAYDPTPHFNQPLTVQYVGITSNMQGLYCYSGIAVSSPAVVMTIDPDPKVFNPPIHGGMARLMGLGECTSDWLNAKIVHLVRAVTHSPFNRSGYS